MLTRFILLWAVLLSYQATLCHIIFLPVKSKNEKNYQDSDFRPNLQGKTGELFINDKNGKLFPTTFLQDFLGGFGAPIDYRSRRNEVKTVKKRRNTGKFQVLCLMDSSGYSLYDLLRCIDTNEFENDEK